MNETVAQWTREQAAREAGRSEMFREMVREELEAQFYREMERLEPWMQEKLAGYARLSQVQSLRRELEELKATLGQRGGHERSFRELRQVDEDHDRSEREDSPDHRRLAQRHRRRQHRADIRDDLPEQEPSDPRFTNLVSWRRYRLHDRDPSVGPEVSRNVGLWTRRLKSSMEKHTFDGSKPVACLRFLSA